MSVDLKGSHMLSADSIAVMAANTVWRQRSHVGAHRRERPRRTARASGWGRYPAPVAASLSWPVGTMWDPGRCRFPVKSAILELSLAAGTGRSHSPSDPCAARDHLASEVWEPLNPGSIKELAHRWPLCDEGRTMAFSRWNRWSVAIQRWEAGICTRRRPLCTPRYECPERAAGYPGSQW